MALGINGLWRRSMAYPLRLVACLFVLLSINVFAVDTDGDGFSDADEATLGTDPNDPTSPLENKLTASDGAADDFFGQSVSISGNTAVIGAHYDDDNGSNSGSAYVYVRNNDVWSEQAKLTASDGASYYYFGHTVSIDGNTIVVGAYDGNGTMSGSAYVFMRSNDVWSEEQKLTASDDAADDRFGMSVSIDGDTAVIGAYADDNDNGNNSGSAYVFPLAPQHQDTPASITGTTSANVDIGGFGFGTLIATDVDGLTDGSYFTISTPPVNGQALINAATGNWIYTANNSYTGSDPFTVTITDDLGGTTEQVVSITITAPDSDRDGAYDHQDNCPSVSNADQANLDGDTFGDACDNDKDGDGFTSDFDLNDLNAYFSTDPDGDGVDSSGESHYENNVCLKPPGCNDNDPCITVCYVPPQDNCPFINNSDQNDLDNDNIGNVCDPDADGDGLLISFEDRLGGSDMDANDASFVLSNANTYFENAPADADLDGVPDEYETAAGGDTTSSTFESVLAMLSVNKNVPAMGGIGLLILGISIFSLGFIKSKKK